MVLWQHQGIATTYTKNSPVDVLVDVLVGNNGLARRQHHLHLDHVVSSHAEHGAQCRVATAGDVSANRDGQSLSADNRLVDLAEDSGNVTHLGTTANGHKVAVDGAARTGKLESTRTVVDGVEVVNPDGQGARRGGAALVIVAGRLDDEAESIGASCR